MGKIEKSTMSTYTSIGLNSAYADKLVAEIRKMNLELIPMKYDSNHFDLQTTIF